jgi:hypothetical protein
MCSIMCVRVCEMCVGMHACLLPVLACAWLYAYVCMHSAIRMYELCVHASNLCASECPVKHVCASLVRATLFSLRTFVDQSRETERESVCAQACIKHTYKSCKYMHMHTHTHPWIHAHVTQIDVASIHARALAHTHTHTHTHTHASNVQQKKAKQRGGTYARRKPRVWDAHACLRGTSKSCASRGRGARPRKTPFQGRRGGLTVLSSQV